MKYYNLDKDGIKETPELEVQECILKCVDIKTKEKIKLIMDKETFNNWRQKMKGDL